MSRSSSSPDVLAPPGDADYIISSPVKPFSGRQSFMSPANFRPLKTPRKRQRVSLGPDKSAHSIKFDDVLLPGSPSMKLDRQPRSPSPDKLPSDGNVSPWRIRLTLEATQDENNQGSPGRKRRASPTKTTKVPLRDEQDHTAQASPSRRGRPRKSAVQGDATPNAGSPGHTPGPRGTGQKRKRGRPRKSAPEPEVPQDTRMHGQTPIVEPGHGWSPLNIAADGESDAGLPDNQLADPFLDYAMEQRYGSPGEGTGDGSPPRVTFNTPDVGAIDGDMDDDQYPYSTPSKMPSPGPASFVPSPENTLHAGHTPRPRTYPTPSSSQVGEDQEQEEPDIVVDEFDHHSDDPTDDHREFDSIVESEEFSMVSLDTLPSVKQHGLGGNEKLAKGPLKPFLERESIGIADRKMRRSPVVDSDRQHPSPTARLPADGSPRVQSRSPEVQDHHIGNGSTPATNALDVAASAPTPRRPFRLARIVRVGIVLGGVMKHQLGDMASHEAPRSDIEDSKKRLEVAFDGFHPEIKRILQAGLGLGQELAKRRGKMEAEKARERADAEAAEITDTRGGSEEDAPEQAEHAKDDDVNPEMEQRMAEWQEEREAISREIETANPNQVVVINSDDADGPEHDENVYEDGPLDEEGEDPVLEPGPEPDPVAEQEPDQGPEPMPEQEEEQEEESDPDQLEQDLSDEDSLDIWQEEARDQSQVSHWSSTNRRPENEHRPPSSHTSSLSAGALADDANFPADWAKNSSAVPYLGQSRVRQLREQEVDLSSLFREEYTPRRYQYYYGKGSPPSGSGQRRRQTSGLSKEREEPIQQSDPKLSPNGNAFDQQDQEQQDLWISAGNDLHSDQMAEDAENQGIPDSPAAERSTHDANVTPSRPRQTNPDIQGSSWFQRLTSFTPGWLRAPNDKQNEEIPENEEESSEVITEDPSENMEDDTPDSEPQPAPPAPEPERQPKQRTPPGQPPKERENQRPATDTATDTIEQRLANRKPLEYPLPFSNAHYAALRRLYWHARRYPDAFPYYPLPGRTEMIGEWLSTSDRVYGVLVSEQQFAIVDQFKLELEDPDTDLADGGWVEADLHRRLVSVIIGEQIRSEYRGHDIA
ncbi:hypothetical protein PHISP_04599 [Aspergillus sp. HF37]|nr:hypothetical protein PHISP_04599 [Aspergillus sp. HF37]